MQRSSRQSKKMTNKPNMKQIYEICLVTLSVTLFKTFRRVLSPPPSQTLHTGINKLNSAPHMSGRGQNNDVSPLAESPADILVK